MGNLPHIEIYTDACARSPRGVDVISWGSGVCLGGIHIISGWLFESPSLEINDKTPSFLKWVKGLHRLISSFGLLGNYAAARLWAPGRLCNTDRTWLGIPIVADNQRNYFILKKHYATSRPSDWVLKEMAVRNLTNNVTITSKRYKGDSGTRSAPSEKVGRNPPPTNRGGFVGSRPFGRFGFLVYKY